MKTERTGLHKMKTGISLLLSSVILSALLTGCSFGSGYTGPKASRNSGAVMELTFQAPSDYRDAISPLTRSFNLSKSSIHVSVNYVDSAMLLLSGDSSGNLPSMWFIYAGYYGNLRVGDCYDLTAYATKNNWEDKFNSDALSLCESDDRVIGYPTYIAYGGVYYSKSLFEQYGLEVPETMEEFESLCAALMGNYIYPFSLPSSSLCFEQLVEYCAGADLNDQLLSRSAAWNCDSVVSAFTTLQKWTVSNYLYMAPDLEPLKQGVCAMSFYIATDVSVPDSLDSDEYGWFPFPNGTGRLPVYAEMVQFNDGLSDGELEACMEYLDYIYSDKYAAQYAGDLPMPFATLESEDASSDPFLPTIYTCAAKNGFFLHISEALWSGPINLLDQITAAFRSGTQTPEGATNDFQAMMY